jgi:hypothetical protein
MFEANRGTGRLHDLRRNKRVLLPEAHAESFSLQRDDPAAAEQLLQFDCVQRVWCGEHGLLLNVGHQVCAWFCMRCQHGYPQRNLRRRFSDLLRRSQHALLPGIQL